MLMCTAGCFDREEEAAKAYDKMMLWCELHNVGGVKSGITNYEMAAYEKELQWLQRVSQVGGGLADRGAAL